MYTFTERFEEEILEGKGRKGMKMPGGNVSSGGQRKHRDPEGRRSPTVSQKARRSKWLGSRWKTEMNEMLCGALLTCWCFPAYGQEAIP